VDEVAVYVPAWADICLIHGGVCHRCGSAPEVAEATGGGGREEDESDVREDESRDAGA
jgi:hypothetical protein